MKLMLIQNYYALVFDNQEEAKNAVEVLGDIIADAIYEKKANEVFRNNEIPQATVETIEFEG